MANWNEAIDNKFQWHDLFNPVGMASYIGGNVKNLFSGNSSSLKHAEMREDTAIQRQVADMKAAGINPVLTATNGFSGASSSASQQAISNNSSNVNSITNLLSSALMLFLATKGVFKK